MLRITPKQARTVHRLARDQCYNCVDGNCLLLDDGDGHPCVQLISYYGIRKWNPQSKTLRAQLTRLTRQKRV